MAAAGAQSTLVEVLGLSSTALGFAFTLSPAPVMWEVYKARSTGQYDISPYSFGTTSCIVWTMYLLSGSPILVWPLVYFSASIFGYGAYTVLFMKYAEPCNRRKFVLNLIGCCAFLLLTVLVSYMVAFIVNSEDAAGVDAMAVEVAAETGLSPGINFGWHTQTLGVFAVISTAFLDGAPLTVAYHCWKHRTTEGLPLPIIVALITLASTLLVYGLLVEDGALVAQNGMGLTLGILEFALYCYCRYGEEERKEKLAQDLVSEVSTASEVVVVLETHLQDSDESTEAEDVSV